MDVLCRFCKKVCTGVCLSELEPSGIPPEEPVDELCYVAPRSPGIHDRAPDTSIHYLAGFA